MQVLDNWEQGSKMENKKIGKFLEVKLRIYSHSEFLNVCPIIMHISMISNIMK
jgi:hypothetical protein